MAASFAGASFEERGEGAATFPTWSYEANYTELEIPDGQSVLQVGGVKSGRLSLAIRCTKAQLDSLKTKVSQQGSLTFSYGTFTAFLISVTDAKQVRKGVHYFATLNFIKR